jgi:16S rRNA (cytosine967-C5)-methyltransferase
MRTAATARTLAVEILRETLEHGGRATALLAEGSPELSAEDADLLRRIVLGVLRNRARLDEELSTVCRMPLSRLSTNLREILEVALYQIRYLDRVPAYAAVDEAVSHAKSSGGRGAASLVNAVLRNLLRLPPLPPGETGERPADAAALSRRFSHPRFLVARWLARLGTEATLSILEADNAASGLDLMANARRTSREALAAALLAEGVVTRPAPLSPLALTVVSGNPLRSPLFAAGHFAIQDLASQALARLLPAGDTLVDLAAAPGGKSFGALLLGRARRAVALDRSVSRLRLVCENRARLGIPEAHPAAGDFLAPPLKSGEFDRVLLDAPCSGTGTLRKNPEIRYRVTAGEIERLTGVQEKALESAADLLAPGGFLLYATCSLEEEENERVVERVLGRSKDLVRAPINAPDALRPFVTGDRFQILPAADNDGFTAHLMRRSERAMRPPLK